MKFKVTLKGSVPKMALDGPAGKYFSDSSYGYSKIEIDAINQQDLSSQLDTIMAGTDLKLIGIDWDCGQNHEDDEQPCPDCLRDLRIKTLNQQHKKVA